MRCVRDTLRSALQMCHAACRAEGGPATGCELSGATCRWHLRCRTQGVFLPIMCTGVVRGRSDAHPVGEW
jgi:hypothetical protein